MKGGCGLFQPAADVVPRSEYDALMAMLKATIAGQKTLQKALAERVEVEKVIDQIIRKKSEVRNYWINDVKQYRAKQGYSDIEHDVDNFLRGYNEAIEDMLAILDGERKDKR